MKLVEIFTSIDGEGPHAGALSIFVRFYGCNLRCSYCDTKYSYEEDNFEEVSADEVFKRIMNIREVTNINDVTITGGEPLIQEDISLLLACLSHQGFHVWVETNGTIIAPLHTKNIRWIFDYKLDSAYPNATKESILNTDAILYHLERTDTIKCVVSTQKDLWDVYNMYRKSLHWSGPTIYISKVFESGITYDEIVQFMKDKQMVHAKLQIQLHKIVWPPEMRGV